MEVNLLKRPFIHIQLFACRVAISLGISQLRLMILLTVLLLNIDFCLALLLVALQGILAVVLTTTKFAFKGSKKREELEQLIA